MMKTDATMNLERFQAILDAYGADARRWPAAEQAAALKLAESNAAARAARDAALSLDEAMDGALDGADVAAVPAALERRILDDFRAQSRGGPSWRRWAGAGALAASLVVGVLAAWPLLDQKNDVDLRDAAAWDALGEDLEYVDAGAKGANPTAHN